MIIFFFWNAKSIYAFLFCIVLWQKSLLSSLILSLLRERFWLSRESVLKHALEWPCRDIFRYPFKLNFWTFSRILFSVRFSCLKEISLCKNIQECILRTKNLYFVSLLREILAFSWELAEMISETLKRSLSLFKTHSWSFSRISLSVSVSWERFPWFSEKQTKAVARDHVLCSFTAERKTFLLARGGIF